MGIGNAIGPWSGLGSICGTGLLLKLGTDPAKGDGLMYTRCNRPSAPLGVWQLAKR